MTRFFALMVSLSLILAGCSTTSVVHLKKDPVAAGKYEEPTYEGQVFIQAEKEIVLNLEGGLKQVRIDRDDIEHVELPGESRQVNGGVMTGLSGAFLVLGVLLIVAGADADDTGSQDGRRDDPASRPLFETNTSISNQDLAYFVGGLLTAVGGVGVSVGVGLIIEGAIAESEAEETWPLGVPGRASVTGIEISVRY